MPRPVSDFAMVPEPFIQIRLPARILIHWYHAAVNNGNSAGSCVESRGMTFLILTLTLTAAALGVYSYVRTFV